MAVNDLTVIGGGIVGLAVAVCVQQRGARVTLVDKAEPGRACSYGNAGILAVSDVLPLVSARRLLTLPGMMMKGHGPAVVKPAALPAVLPWFARAATTLGSNRQRHIIAALSDLNGHALKSWRSMLSDCGAEQLLIERGMIELTRASLGVLAAAHEQLAGLKQKTTLLSGDETREIEPNLSDAITGGLLHEAVAHVRDPFLVSGALQRRLRDGGGIVIQAHVTNCAVDGDGVRMATSAGDQHAARAIVCAGSGSPALLRPYNRRIPLQIERGYHLDLPLASDALGRPAAFRSEAFVATPMTNRLRLAGTVEFANPGTRPSWHRSTALLRHAQPYFRVAMQADGAARWTGDRPSFPDSLPAIGATAGGRILYAFGHQHLGLTQAAITAELVRHIHDGTAAPFDVSRFALDRFGLGAT